MFMTELVERNDDGGIATLSLNRPDALNALSPQMFVELRAHIDTLAGQGEEIGVVILRGNGRSFSAGNDLKAIQSGERAPSPHFQAETLHAIEALPQVVLVSVSGHCYTGALELAIAGDLLICADDARFCDTHGKWAMVPTWGMSTRLPQRVGSLAAKDMMFSGRVVSGVEAAQIGLANRSVPVDDLVAETAAWADQIAANSWHTLREEKRIMLALGEMGRDQGIKWDRANSPGTGPDMQERIAAGFGKK
jgi:enoyl-CoA hydratase